jgi:hypothetical protein
MDAATTAPRERGWGLLVLALLASLVVAAAPVWPGAAGLAAAVARLAVPVEQTLLLVIPALAACAVVAWWHGGSAWLAVVWLAFAGWTIAQPFAPGATAAAGGGYPSLARGWAVTLAAAFGLVGMVAPRHPFLGRALAALGLASAVAAGALVLAPRGPERFVRLVTAEYGRRVEGSLAAWHRAEAGAAWQEAVGRVPELADRAARTAARLSELPAPAARLVPALVALESLAALALAWALFHRLSRTRLGPPLGALAGFRFNDQLIWGLVVGATFVLLPSLAALRPVGANLLLFFGALYALRGLGVLRWLASEKVAAGGALALALLVFVLGPVLVGGSLAAVALVVGLADGWSDWRRRVRPGRPTA